MCFSVLLGELPGSMYLHFNIISIIIKSHYFPVLFGVDDPSSFSSNFIIKIIWPAYPVSMILIMIHVQAKRLQAIMMTAAELAALRLKDLPFANHKVLEIDHRNRIFHLLDKNGDGRISIEELTEVMEELGAGSKDAQELMQLLDSNCDGSLSSEEFDLFQRQVSFS